MLILAKGVSEAAVAFGNFLVPRQTASVVAFSASVGPAAPSDVLALGRFVPD